MKRLNSAGNNSDAPEFDALVPVEHDGGYYDGYYGAENKSDERKMLREIISALRKHWLLILTINLLITAVTVAYVAQKPDYYTATARVQVNAENNPAAGTTSVIVTNPGNDPGYFATQLQILEGAGLLRRVAKSLDLENNENFLHPSREKRLTVWQNVKRMFGFYPPPDAEKTPVVTFRTSDNKLNLSADKSLDPDAETEKYAPIVSVLKKKLTVSPVKDSRTGSRETRLIDIEYTHSDPQVVAKIVNTIGDVYVLQNLEQKVQSNASAGDFLQKRVAELQSSIRRGEERLINYSKDNQIVSLDPGQNTVVQRFADLSMKLGQAENDRINAQSAYQAAMQNQMRTATAETADPQVAALESRLNELKRNLAQLKTEYTDEWYEVVQTKKQIESIENQLLPLRKRASDIQTATLEEKLGETVAREKELRENFNKQRDEVVRQNEAAINYKIIQQEIATNKTLLDGLLQRSRENDVILNGTPNNVLVAERASVPQFAAGPDRMKTVLFAFFASLFAGCGLAFLLDRMNDSIHYSDDIENLLGLPVLAAIPAAPQTLGKRLSGVKLLRNRNNRRDYNLAVFEKPEYSEAYSQLKTYLMLSSPGSAPKTILVTSGEASEGKTLTALNVATSLAKDGSPVLLIDADLRCPRIHSLREINNQSGLTTLLTSKDVTYEEIAGTIQKDAAGLPDVLTAGGHTVNPAGLLSSEEMQNLLKNLAPHYKHIVIDSPPVLYFADGAILSTLVDAVVIVARDSVTSRALFLKAKKMLFSVGANIVGIVINGVPLQWGNYSRYKKYESNRDLPPDTGYQLLNLH